MPDVGRVDVSERPVHLGLAHGRAGLADVVEDRARVGARAGWVAIQVFAANGDADDVRAELGILLDGCGECVQLVRDGCLPRRAPDPEQEARACLDGCGECGGRCVRGAVFDHGVQACAVEARGLGQLLRGGELGREVRASVTG